MNEANKVRQWWLNLNSDNRGFSSRKPDDWLLRGGEGVHVIEAEPVLKILEEMAEALKEIDRKSDCICNFTNSCITCKIGNIVEDYQELMKGVKS